MDINKERLIERICNVQCGASPDECLFKIVQEGESCTLIDFIRNEPAAHSGCVFRNMDGLCIKFTTGDVRSYCVDGPCEYAVPSNADRIRLMTDEELAHFLSDIADCNVCPNYYSCEDHTGFTDGPCEGMMLGWLQEGYTDG